ncbi:MAG: FAD-dependent oxidoreductase, partial [Myxococcota bacterium]
LAGLSVAAALERAGRTYCLVEARDRLGGRIQTQAIRGGDGVASFDLGPAWFWPGQPRMAALVAELGLSRFGQYATGQGAYEDERGVVRGRGLVSMAGSFRVVGGLSALIDGLAERSSADCRHTRSAVARVEDRGEHLRAVVQDAGGTPRSFDGRHVVLALPPRLAASRIDFAGAVSDDALQAMRDIPTWMAGHAKVLAVYDRPFWREAGLSGDAGSRRGPLAEIHDASPDAGGPYGLFGFVGVPPEARGDQERLLGAAKAQLVRIFGDAAGNPISLTVHDWAAERHTATKDDHRPLRAHPDYGLPPVLEALCGGRLILAGSEVGATFGGYLEGALEAAEHAVKRLT